MSLKTAVRCLAGIACLLWGAAAPAHAGPVPDAVAASRAASETAWQRSGVPCLKGVTLARFGKRVQVHALTSAPATVQHGWAAGKVNRLWVDVRGVYVTPNTVVPLPPAGTVISRVRVAQYKSDPPVSRIVLDVKPGYGPLQATPAGRAPAVVSYPGGRPSTSVARVPNHGAKGRTVKVAAAPKRKPAPVKTRGGRSFVVAIDAGHGGRDPGASGPRGLREKRVALDVARRLAETLRRKGHRVHLSRTTDRTTTPAMRTAWLKRTRSDVMVSIHCDSSPVRSYRGGASTYYHGAHRPSRALARAVQRKMVRTAGARDAGIKSDFSRFGRGFYLLRRARRPAALVEVGYISNPGTEKLLATAAYRQKLAEGIGAGILDYLN